MMADHLAGLQVASWVEIMAALMADHLAETKVEMMADHLAHL